MFGELLTRWINKSLHFETINELKLLLKIYGYSYEQFISMSSGKNELSQSIRQKYLEFIKSQKTLRTMLQSY